MANNGSRNWAAKETSEPNRTVFFFVPMAKMMTLDFNVKMIATKENIMGLPQKGFWTRPGDQASGKFRQFTPVHADLALGSAHQMCAGRSFSGKDFS